MSRNMKLVQGELIIKFDISSFVNVNMDSDEVEEHLEKLALDNIENGDIECEILTDVWVDVDEEVCDKYEGEIISDYEWKEILSKDIEH